MKIIYFCRQNHLKMFELGKTTTALLICSAFVFRLLFLEITFLSFNGISKTSLPLTQHISSSKNKISEADVSSSENIKYYSAVEVCEENSDNEEDFAKFHSPVILSIVYSAFLNQLNFIPKPNILFGFIKSGLPLKKYLSISVLRI